MITAGIDAGSRSTKVVLFDATAGTILGLGLVDQGVQQERLASELLEHTCREAGLSPARIQRVVATGYGRNAVGFAHTTITEITCHAKGVHYLEPSVRTIVEIGGQDSKYILLDEQGRVSDFGMNDRCAAGSGRFLEVVASRLGVTLAGFGEISAKSNNPAVISSVCVVFAESEIIGLLAQGVPPPDIAAGVQNSIAQRLSALVGRSVKEPICFTGGVALQPSMRRALESCFSRTIGIVPMPQHTGALGAALLGWERKA